MASELLIAIVLLVLMAGVYKIGYQDGQDMYEIDRMAKGEHDGE